MTMTPNSTTTARDVFHTPQHGLAPRRGARCSVPLSLLLGLVLSGCGLASRAAVAEPVAYAPDPMLSPAEFDDGELARDLATRHLAARSSGLVPFEYARVEPAARSRAHGGDVAIMVLDGPVRLQRSDGDRELRQGSVVLIPAGVRYRLGPSEGGPQASALVVGSAEALSTWEEGGRPRVARRVP